MGRGRILQGGLLEDSLGSGSPTPVVPSHLNLHLCFPAGIGGHHLFIQSPPTVVGGVHLGAGGNVAQAPSPSASPPSLSWSPLACFRMFSMRLIRRGLVLAWNLLSPEERGSKRRQAQGLAQGPRQA